MTAAAKLEKFGMRTVATLASIAIFTLGFAAQVAHAACGPHELTPPAQVNIAGRELMIVTHPSSTYDARLVTKRGIDEAVRLAKRMKIPVAYLQDDSPAEYYFPDDCRPDYWVSSQDGEVPFDVPEHVYVIGGHLEQCLSRTLHDVLLSWKRNPKQNLTITYLMDGIYSNGKSFDETDRYYPDFQRFMGVVTHGRPAGEHWPKLSLLEIMGIILTEPHEIDFLTKTLPHYERTLPQGYQVELKLNEALKVLRKAPGWRPPTLRFEFLDSALELGKQQL